ncbi:MAG: Bifunctional ligase/repressor BirA [Eubacteriales bacterium SKADARSKE-1]|nr:Bifunctional ligase/repressor BirA [Eubacteriales bacterium SKADARSKE-1]
MNGYNIPLLQSATSSFKKIIYLKETDSTNNAAKDLISNNMCDNNTIIIAEHQTHGRGKGSSVFYSPKDVGIYISIVLKNTNLDLKFLSMITPLAVAQAIKETANINAFIKWPNDILINNKKVCGTLIEAATNCISENLNYVIVGIGVNVNNDKTEFDDSIKKIATSIKLETGKDISKNMLCCNILKQFELLLNENHYLLASKYKSYLKV